MWPVALTNRALQGSVSISFLNFTANSFTQLTFLQIYYILFILFIAWMELAGEKTASSSGSSRPSTETRPGSTSTTLPSPWLQNYLFIYLLITLFLFCIFNLQKLIGGQKLPR